MKSLIHSEIVEVVSRMLVLAAIGQHAYDNQTTMTPLAAVIVALFCGVILMGSRPQALGAMLGIVCFIPVAQRIAIAGLDFDPLRLLVVAGIVRVISRGELAAVKARSVDYVFAAYAIVAWTCFCILYGFTPSAVIYRCGEMYTVVGVYVLCRSLLRSREDIERLARLLAVLAIPVSVFFIVEWLTGRNMFSAFGGVPAITIVREGKLRCQGAFSHSILAGCFWAGVMPIAASLFWSKRANPLLAFIGTMAAVIIVLSCSSSTPAMMLVSIIAFALIYPVRALLPVFVSMFVGVAMVRWIVGGNPPWHLIARIDLVGGSTGWHRYHLIDQAIRRFPEWCLVGTRSTYHWGWGLDDVTNQYLLEGVRGGFVSMALYITVLVLAFRALAKGLRNHRGNAAAIKVRWCIVCALVAHSAAFFAVSYFGPVLVIYWVTVSAAFALDDDSQISGQYIVEWDEADDLTEADVSMVAALTGEVPDRADLPTTPLGSRDQ